MTEITKEAAQCWGAESANTYSSFLSPLAGIIGVYGYIRQYQLQQDALALSERGVVIAERSIELAERTFNEIALPTFQRFKNYFDDCVADMKTWQRRFIEKAFECDEYEAQYDLQEGRIKAREKARFDALRKQVRRSRGQYSVGYVCDQDIRLGIAEATAISDNVNRAYRYEDAKKIRLDQQCFERCQAGASLANTITGQAFNGLNGAASVTANAVRNVQSATTTLVSQLNEAATFTNQNADFFGSLGNSAFRFLGFNSFQAPQTGGVIGSPYGFGGGNNIFTNGINGNQGVPPVFNFLN